MKNLFTPTVVQDKEEKKKYRLHVSLSVLILFVVGSLINIPFSREVKRLNNIDVKLNERSEEHTLNSSHQINSYAVFCWKKKTDDRLNFLAA